jgi:hypothetical protein
MSTAKITKETRSIIMKAAWAAWKNTELRDHVRGEMFDDTTFGECLEAAWLYAKKGDLSKVELHGLAGREGYKAIRKTFDPEAFKEADVTIALGWHKSGDSIAATYKQINFLEVLLSERGYQVPWCSNTNAQRIIRKDQASELIGALKSGETIQFINS